MGRTVYYDHRGNEVEPPKADAVKQTNADRIRAMTDEELAGWLEKIRLYCATDLCGRSCPLAEVCYSNAKEPKETLDWLKEEAVSDG